MIALLVSRADVQDRDGGRAVGETLRGRTPQLKKILADSAYRGDLVAWFATELGITLEIVIRPEQRKGFEVEKWRWIVERTFAWLYRCRRLSKDYETLCESSETMIRLAMIRLMVNRLAHPIRDTFRGRTARLDAAA